MKECECRRSANKNKGNPKQAMRCLQKDSRTNQLSFNSNLECKWLKFCNQNVQTG